MLDCNKNCSSRSGKRKLFPADLQCPVDDALDLVHDVVLGKQMVQVSVGWQPREVDGCSAEEAENCVGGRVARRAGGLHDDLKMGFILKICLK